MIRTKSASLSQTESAEAVRRFEAGETAKDLATNFGVTRWVVYGAIRRAGLQPESNRSHKGRPKPVDRGAIIAEYLDGASIRTVAKKHQMSYAGVRNILRKKGISVRGSFKNIEGVTDQMLVDAYESGESLSAIGRRIGSCQGTVGRKLRRLGIAIRSQGHELGPKHPAWKGGRVVFQGYVRIWIDPTHPMRVMADTSGYVLEHRLIMAEHLGRVLTPNETVHHKNGIRGDNSIENLQIRTGNHGPGVCLKCADCGSINIVGDDIK